MIVEIVIINSYWIKLSMIWRVMRILYDENIINRSASYIENILNCYKSELFLNFVTIREALKPYIAK